MTDTVDPYWTDDEPTTECDGQPDVAIVPYVNALHDAGIETRGSCAGHTAEESNETPYPAYGYIDFDVEEGRFDPYELVDDEEFARIERMYKPTECWRVEFYGLIWSDDHLQAAMAGLFNALDVDLP